MRPQDISSPFHTPEQTTTPYSSRNKNSQENLNLMKNTAKIVARKPAVLNGKGNIDDWIESMKAFFACSFPLNSTEELIYAKVKTYMDADVVRAFKHTIEGETCT